MPIAAFTGLRGYALSRNWQLAATIFVLSFSPIAANVAQWVLGTTALVQPYGCVAEVSVTDLQYIIAVRLTRRTDYLRRRPRLHHLAHSIHRTADWARREAHGEDPHGYHALERVHLLHVRRAIPLLVSNRAPHPLAHNNLRILFILNAIHITLLLQSLLRGTAIAETSYMTRYTDPITTVLTYRFLIDLQKSSQQDVKLGSDDPLHIAVDSTGSLSFVNRALGSIGATIDLGISAKSEPDKDVFSPKTSVHESDAGNGTMGPLDVMEEARFVGGPLSVARSSRPW
ncbi:hypothetical protein K466DRAFT_202783 [Polyporus arcularius HHB13444]|uniref:Uncharacterized protein n=1 Tax=Polyporus arcularius HHB13444 TaxID=1314778 RepID=A0A5C3P848_9APHY|nr:hypothetical protein K466DRAFT_202783 [Polyporus arcularius HHB13444]